MKTLSVKAFAIMACVSVSSIGTATTKKADTKPSLKLKIEQNGKIVKPNSKGMIYLSRTTFAILFILEGSIDPPVKLNLSLNRNNYDGIRSGKKPDTFFTLGLGMAEGGPPPDDYLVVFEKSFPGLEAMHYLIRDRFHRCKDRGAKTVCKRMVKRLSLESNPRNKSIEYKLRNFPPKPVYISAAVIASPHPNTTDITKMSFVGRATAIIQFK